MRGTDQLKGTLKSAREVRDAVRVTTPARVLNVLVGGTLGQRTVLVLGIGVVVFALFKSLLWLALVLGGWVLCYFAVRDFERTEQL